MPIPPEVGPGPPIPLDFREACVHILFTCRFGTLLAKNAPRRNRFTDKRLWWPRVDRLRPSRRSGIRRLKFERPRWMVHHWILSPFLMVFKPWALTRLRAVCYNTSPRSAKTYEARRERESAVTNGARYGQNGHGWCIRYVLRLQRV